MMEFRTFLIVGLVLSLKESTGFEIGWVSVSVPEKPLELWQVTLRCISDLDYYRQLPDYTIKWYKDGNEFYRYTTNTQNPIQLFDVEGVHVVPLFSNMKEILLEDLSYESAGMYRCEINTDGPNADTKFDEERMGIESYSRGINYFRCMPQIFNDGQSLKIGCYYLVNGTNTAREPWNFNWYKDGQLIYSYTPEGTTLASVPGVFLDPRRTYKNYIILRHVSNNTNGKYVCEITLEARGSPEQQMVYRHAINVNYF